MAKLKTDTKDRKKNNSKIEGSTSQVTGGDEKTGMMFYILVVLTALVIMAVVFGGAFFVILRNNVNGLGEKFRKDLQDIPVLKLALPKVEDPLDEKFMSEAEVRKKYTEMRENLKELNNKMADLEKKKDQLAKDVQSSQKDKADGETALKAAEAMKTQLEADRIKLGEEQKKLNEAAARGDTEGFKDYFEKVDKEAAEKIYKEVMEKEKTAAEVKSFVQLYETMDASKAAKILEQFGTQKLDLVVSIMKNMKRAAASEILASMSPVYAAKVTERLSRYFNLN